MTGKVALGEICQFVGGGTPSRKVRRYWDGDIPWATVKDFGSERISTTAEFISQEGLTNSASTVVPAGTVLLVTRVGLGKVAIAGVDLAINQDVKAITPSNGVLPEFLFWSLKHLGPEIERKGTGATVKGVTLQDVRKLEIPLPPLDEQRRIVGILNRAAKIERLRAQAQERLREFLPALFIKMFGDQVENPHGYQQQKLSECASFISGATPSKRNGSYWEGEIPWISPKDMKVDLISDSETHVSNLAFTDTNLKAVPANTSLIVIRGMILAHTVPIAITARTVAINQDMKAINFDSAIDPVFGFWCLRALQHRILDDVDTAAHGTRRIEMSRLGDIPIHIPCGDQQRRYVQLVNRARATFAVVHSRSGTLSDLTSCLMSSLLAEG